MDEILGEHVDQDQEILCYQSEESLQREVPLMGDNDLRCCLLGEDASTSEDHATSGWLRTSAEKFLEAEEHMVRVHRLLGDLPKMKRHTFVLSVLEAYDLSAIAMLQHRTELNVQVDIDSARDQLRGRLRAGVQSHSACQAAETTAAVSTEHF